MAPDTSILRALDQADRGRLQAELDALELQIKELQAQREIVLSILEYLALKSRREDGVADIKETRPPTATGSLDDVGRRSPLKSTDHEAGAASNGHVVGDRGSGAAHVVPQGGRSVTRELIVQLMRTRPESEWSPAVVTHSLRARGVDAVNRNVGVTMSRMVQKGQLERRGDGRYVLPAGPDVDEGGGQFNAF